MTSATEPMPQQGSSWSQHLSGTLTLGIPLVAAQVAQYAIHATDVLIVSKLGTIELAAIVIGAQYFFTIFMFGSGISTAAIPMAAQAQGKGDVVAVRRAIRMSIWVCVLYATLTLPLFFKSEGILLALGQEPDVAKRAARYLSIIAFGAYPALIFMCLRAFLSALEKARIIFYITLAVLSFNALFAYTFVLGHFSMPQLGLEGAAMVAVAANTFGLLLITAYILKRPELAKYELFVRFWRPDWGAFFEVTRLGLPISTMVVAEASLFTVASLMAGWIGTAELAAHGIALQFCSFTFMVPYGLSQAATVRVGLASGRGNKADVLRAGLMAIFIAAAFAVSAASFLFIFPQTLARVYVDPNDPQAAAVIATAIPLLMIGGAFQIFDGMQSVGAGLARGLKDSTVPMVIALISYWPMGFLAAYLLAFKVGIGANGIWFGFLIGLAVAAVALNFRFFQLWRNMP